MEHVPGANHNISNRGAQRSYGETNWLVQIARPPEPGAQQLDDQPAGERIDTEQDGEPVDNAARRAVWHGCFRPQPRGTGSLQ